MEHLGIFLVGGLLVLIGLCGGSYLSRKQDRELIQHLQLKNESLSSIKSQLEIEVVNLSRITKEFCEIPGGEKWLKDHLGEDDLKRIGFKELSNVDYGKLDEEEFDKILFNLLEKAEWYTLLRIKGVYEAVVNNFRDDVLAIWTEEQKD